MSPDSRRDVLGGRDAVDDGRGTGKASTPAAARRGIRLLDSTSWETNCSAPFQFLRWLSAVAMVVAEWVEAGAPHSLISYLPVLLIVALLLLPDAQSITIGASGLKFERLSNEVAQQRRDVDRLAEAVVSLISTNASSNVTITIGPAELAALAAATAQRQEQRKVDLLPHGQF
jgi:hypothetical protein